MKNKEIEFLPPTPRYKCEVCEKEYKKVEVCSDGKKRCRQCKKKRITNPFYVPEQRVRSKNYVGKYNLSDTEKRLLGSRNTKDVSKWLNTLKRKKSSQKRSNKQKQILEKEDEANDKFLKGLGLKSKTTKK